jgi:hypothetical protein
VQTTEVHPKIMMSKAGTEFHKFRGFMRLAHVPPHYGHLMISEAPQE